MPPQKPGKSETVVLTPKEFVRAAAKFLGISQFSVDLAALKSNAHCLVYIGPKTDSLAKHTSWRDWIKAGEWGWLNPPYDNIAPWAQKALLSGRKVAMLVPVSPGSKWWRESVHEQAMVYFLQSRINFLDKDGKKIGSMSKKDGKWRATPYPKDLALIVYGMEPGYDFFNWRQYV